MHGVPRREPTCKEVPVGAPFSPDRTYLGAKALRLSAGVTSWTSLVVETARGLVVTGLRLKEDDPFDPGCGMMVRPELIDSFSLENGHLVVKTGNTRVEYLGENDTEGSLALWQGAVWCKEAATLRCWMYHPEYQEPLAQKHAGPTDRNAEKGWGKLAWVSVVPFTVTATGELRLREAR